MPAKEYSFAGFVIGDIIPVSDILNIMAKERYLRILWSAALIWLCILIVFGWWSLVIKFPTYYPDHTLELQDRVSHVFDRITLPIKYAALAVRDPEPFVLMPVYGVKVDGVADTWHEPRPDNRVHEGQDLFAPKGTPVFSGTRGYVVRISTSEIGGNSVYVLGTGRRVYFYTHFDRFPDELHVGQYVGVDTVLGFVGNTGNAETTPSHLHFGVYDMNVALNPLLFLVDRPKPWGTKQ